MRRHTLSRALAVVAASLVSCSPHGASKTTITFAAGNDPSGATAALIEEYNAAHPDVEVKFQAMPANTDQQHDAYVTYLSAGERASTSTASTSSGRRSSREAGWIKPLPDGFITPDEFLEGPVGSVTYRGRMYAVPWFTDAGVLYYRKDLLRRRGSSVPATWDDFRDRVPRGRRSARHGRVRVAGCPLRGNGLRLPRVPVGHRRDASSLRDSPRTPRVWRLRSPGPSVS